MGLVGLISGFFLPYGFVSCPRTKRFEKFEELFSKPLTRWRKQHAPDMHFTTVLEMIAGEVAEPVVGDFRKNRNSGCQCATHCST